MIVKLTRRQLKRIIKESFWAEQTGENYAKDLLELSPQNFLRFLIKSIEDTLEMGDFHNFEVYNGEMFNVKLHGLSDGLHAVFTFYMAPAYKHDSEYKYDEESNDIKTVGGYYKPEEGLPIVMKLSDLVLGPRNFEQNLDMFFKELQYQLGESGLKLFPEKLYQVQESVGDVWKLVRGKEKGTIIRAVTKAGRRARSLITKYPLIATFLKRGLKSAEAEKARVTPYVKDQLRIYLESMAETIHQAIEKAVQEAQA